MSLTAQRYEDQKTIQIIEQVAEKSDTPPEELPLLYEVIDPDALNGVFESASEPVTVTFSYCECTVTVTGNRHVTTIDVTE